ncbi:hypothetical protein MATL_G00242070 [Megalops atlanticus]|uniref:Uncharacterized protein n=1 Tax=Megalops atlanticus TaxID=7932 RepID=A0A9D3PE17_MEGAT|nr:hypothetical protein MATL_G00242070 [Megalops atlanticus]
MFDSCFLYGAEPGEAVKEWQHSLLLAPLRCQCAGEDGPHLKPRSPVPACRPPPRPATALSSPTPPARRTATPDTAAWDFFGASSICAGRAGNPRDCAVLLRTERIKHRAVPPKPVGHLVASFRPPSAEPGPVRRF